MTNADDGWLVQGSTEPADVSAFYDEWAQRYDADLDQWSYAAPRIVAEAVLQHAPDARVVLDAGCGTGLTGRALRTAGFEGALHGIDLSQESLVIARDSGVYSSVEHADLQQPLAFDDDSFDALSCVGVMTYVPDVEACWREFCRVVRPGGLVVLTQREDLWEPRECQVVIERLANRGVWQPVWVSEPEPYLPSNDDFGDRIGVYYVAALVA
mgnify:CR=1 FL=1